MQAPSLCHFTRHFRLDVLEVRVVCAVPTAVDDPNLGFAWAQPSNPLDVLQNDFVNASGAEFDPSTVTVVTPAQFGALTLDPTTGELLYTPNYFLPPGLPPGRLPPPAPVEDQFTYKVSDTLGQESNVATATMHAGAGGDPRPIQIRSDFGITQGSTPITIDLLANDELLDGSTFDRSTLRITPHFATDPPGGLPLHGSVTLDQIAGTATYTPNSGYIGWDRFGYGIDSTSGLSGTAHVTVLINPGAPRLVPDPSGGNMLLVEGTNQADTIDIVPGNRWNQVRAIVNGVTSPSFRPNTRIVVYGYSGNDTITVSRRVDVPAWLIGGFGNDRLRAGNGPSLLMGSEGNDTLIGGDDRDVLFGGAGEDVLRGSYSADVLVGGRTTLDDQPTELNRVFRTWTRNWWWSESFRSRRAELRDILTDSDLIDDGATDRLNGGLGRNLILGADGTPPDDVILTRDRRRR